MDTVWGNEYPELEHFRGLHLDADIYVLGSGPTAGYFDARFFRDKIVIGVNRAGERHGLFDVRCRLYTLTHYHLEDAWPLAMQYPGHWIFAPDGEEGFAGSPQRRYPNVVYYAHEPTRFDFDVDAAWRDDGLIVGSTSMHGAMHLAAFMGARTIFLVGADCGTLDGAANESGYQSGNLKRDDPAFWLPRWNEHLVAVANKLRSEYLVAIHSLNPFVNLHLEGHVFR